jgi:hypothetical protein
VISTLKVPQSRLQAAFGCNPGGPNINPVGGRTTGWDIFNRTRSIAQGRAPGTGPATIKPQIIGHVNATIYRVHEKTFLDDNRLHLMRRMGNDWGVVDQRGEKYVEGQERHLAQRLRNSREFVLSRALRGQFQLYQNGDDWIPCDSGGHITIDYQNPYYYDSSNSVYRGAATFSIATAAPCTLAQLDAITVTLPGNTTTTTPFAGMDGTSWTSVTTANPIADCFGINAGFEAMHGRQLTTVWCNSTTAQLLLNNTAMKGAAGTANTVYESYTRTVFEGPDGQRDTGFVIVFRALPWLRFMVYDAGLDVFNGTNYVFQKFFPDGYAAFLPDVDQDWFELQEGSEIVRENLLDPGSVRFGMASWVEPKTQPGGFEMISLDNAIPVIYVPSCVAYVQVSGF